MYWWREVHRSTGELEEKWSNEGVFSEDIVITLFIVKFGRQALKRHAWVCTREPLIWTGSQFGWVAATILPSKGPDGAPSVFCCPIKQAHFNVDLNVAHTKNPEVVAWDRRKRGTIVCRSTCAVQHAQSLCDFSRWKGGFIVSKLSKKSCCHPTAYCHHEGKQTFQLVPAGSLIPTFCQAP